MLFIIDGNNLNRYKKVTETELRKSNVNLFKWVTIENGNVFAIVDHPEYIKKSWYIADGRKMRFFSRIFGIELSDMLSLSEENWILSLLRADKQK